MQRSRKGTSTQGRRTEPRLKARNRTGSVKAGVVFGRNLRRVCRARKLDAAVLAKRLRRPKRTIESLLAGQATPGLAIISDIARKLEVSVAELVRGL